MDEDDIDCPPDALGPLCKLRNVRSLALDRNRLTGIPSLICTTTSLRNVWNSSCFGLAWRHRPKRGFKLRRSASGLSPLRPIWN